MTDLKKISFANEPRVRRVKFCAIIIRSITVFIYFFKTSPPAYSTRDTHTCNYESPKSIIAQDEAHQPGYYIY